MLIVREWSKTFDAESCTSATNDTAPCTVGVPVIGCGGISNGTDAIEFLLAGATAVQVGTATFRNPRAPLDTLEGVERYCAEHGVAAIADLIGAAKREFAPAPYLQN